ncbi:MAG TPA: hypothetical protein VGM22_12450, partial [Methylomirabilota bacterium]
MARDDLRGRVLAFIRKVAPFAYCDACLALRLDAALQEITAVLSALIADGECERRRRACYGCGRTLELTVPIDGPRPRGARG